MAAVATSSYNSVMEADKEWSRPLLVRQRISPEGYCRGSASSLDSAITRSSFDSTSSSFSLSTCQSTKQCVSASLDDYVDASIEGREAFRLGNLKGAVVSFNHALAIELQTELDCLYNTSIGYLSGLVRSEVNSRLVQAHINTHRSAQCSRILRQLKQTFYRAAEGLERKHTEPKWYLQMGASLVMINEWEKAKVVYTDGISMCKDCKAVKRALKNLIKIEQITSYAEIPIEDQPSSHSHSPPLLSPLESPTSSPLHSPGPSLSHRPSTSPRPTQSPRLIPSPQPTLTPQLSPTPEPPPIKESCTASLQRVRSKSVGQKLRRQIKERTTSFSHDQVKKEENPQRNNGAAIVVRSSHLHKRSSFGLFTSKRVMLLSLESTTAWSKCFDPTSCRVMSQAKVQLSAIKHMRILSSLDDDVDGGQSKDIGLSEPLTSSRRFSAVALTSMRIEDDDSELDDSD